MERKNVYEAINTEREFVILASADPSRPDMLEDFHMGDTLSAIRYNLNKAENEWYQHPAPYQETLEYLRKIAGLCVAAGEKYGMPKRK